MSHLTLKMKEKQISRQYKNAQTTLVCNSSKQIYLFEIRKTNKKHRKFNEISKKKKEQKK